MPYIPRSLAPSNLPLNLPAAPKAPKSQTTKPQVPYRPDPDTHQNMGVKSRNSLVSKLSMKDWDFSPLKVYQLLTNKEAKSDEYSGLVS